MDKIYLAGIGVDARPLAWTCRGRTRIVVRADVSIQGKCVPSIALHHPDLGQLWGKSFHDRALWADEDAVTAARYIMMNPVRAGLVGRVGDYPFWHAVWV